MITLTMTGAGPAVVVQRETPPAVYLDHWALLDLSASPALGARLVAGIKRRGGSLALSWVNVIEFTKMTDAAQKRAAEDLVERILPDVYFLEVNPDLVIKNEDRLLEGGPAEAPHHDRAFLEAFMSLKPGSITARGLFSIRQRPGLDHLSDVFVQQAEALRNDADEDSSFRAYLENLRPVRHGPRATRVILREIVRSLTLDGHKKIKRTDAPDMFHTVVPTAYCHLVLLDGYWRDQIERCARRFAEAGLTVPIANVYSKRHDGLERFLTELEGSG